MSDLSPIPTSPTDKGEPNCGTNRGGCSQHCTTLPEGSAAGYICHCYHGFRASPDNAKVCEDVNECREFSHNCSQLCTNLNGTFACGCRDGFRKVSRSFSRSFSLSPLVSMSTRHNHFLAPVG